MRDVLSVTGLCTEYVDERGQAIRAAHEVAFEVPEGKLFTLLGPSGCGKTTTLRSIAGLEKPRQGEISVGGDVVYSSQRGIFVPPNRRGLGMVFQSYAIWPHMTVFENAAFPLRVSKKRFSRQESRSVCRGYSRWSRSRRWRAARRPGCRAASSSVLRSLGRWSWSRACCSWTSRFPTWTRSCASACASS